MAYNFISSYYQDYHLYRNDREQSIILGTYQDLRRPGGCLGGPVPLRGMYHHKTAHHHT